METTQTITLKRLLASVAERQASDLHLVVGTKPTVRQNGKLITLDEEDVITEDFVRAVFEIVATEQQQEQFKQTKELIVLYEFVNQNRFRVDITLQRGMLSLVFHFIPSIIKKLTDLGFPKEVEDLTTLKDGLVLCGGQKGSGLTTTLAAFAESINQREARSILILAKPIEYSLVSYKSIIEEQEIGVDTTDWLSALDLNEQDIDVVIVSGVVDGVVWKRLITLANNGVLVCVGFMSASIEDMIASLMSLLDPADRDVYAELFASVFRGAVVQALVPKVGGGSALALEFAVYNQNIRRALSEQQFDQLTSIIQTSRSEGMITLDKYLEELYRSGQIDKAIAQRFARYPEHFDSL